MSSVVTGDAIARHRALVVAKALDVYARTGILVNRSCTPKAMMETAVSITGQQFRPRDYVGAAKALREWASQGQVL